MSQDSVLTTLIFNSKRDGSELRAKRVIRIREAVAFPSGTLAERKRSEIATLPNGNISYFDKPGKETARQKPNIFDMYPNVGTDTDEHFDNWAFEKIWEYLVKISIIQQDTFKKALVLLYRLGYFYDHVNDGGKIRYQPNKDVLACINCIENYVLKAGFKENFGTSEVELLDFLHFVDLLAWNEDVKYHPPVDGQPFFADVNKRNNGRINTQFCRLSVPPC